MAFPGANDGQKWSPLRDGFNSRWQQAKDERSGYEITRTRDAVNNVETYFQQHPDLLKKATGVDQLIPPESGATTHRRVPPSANAINALEVRKALADIEMMLERMLKVDQAQNHLSVVSRTA